MRSSLNPRQILLIRLGSFGDVIFTLPAVFAVRRAFPSARLTFLVYREFASLLEGFPGVETVLTLDRARYRSGNPLAIGAATASLVRLLRRSRFELAVDFQGFGETGWLAWVSGAPQRWGTVYRRGRSWAYTRPVRRDPQLHPVEYHLEVLRKAGGLEVHPIRNEFRVPPNMLAEARRFFAGAALDPERPTLFIQPFTSNPQKSWPLENHLDVARYFRARGGQVLFGGGPDEQAALEPARRAGFAVAAGAPALLSAALVQLSTVVLGGDTGLAHLAVALGKRVIMLMGALGPGACHPFDHKDWVLLPPPGTPLAAIKTAVVNAACVAALPPLPSASCHSGAGPYRS